MADNTQINLNTTPGPFIADEDIGGVHYQQVKLVDADPTKTDPIGTATNPLPTSNICRLTDIFYQTLGNGAFVGVSLVGKPYPFTVWVSPDAASSDGVSVWYRPSINAPWFPWAHGQVTADAAITFGASVESIRFQRSTGTGTTSQVGIS